MKAGAGKPMHNQNNQKFEQVESSVTVCSNFGVVREKIKLPIESQHIEQFKHTYDRVFLEFQKKLMIEYQKTKESYVYEMQQNYQENLEDKNDNIYTFMETIEMKK